MARFCFTSASSFSLQLLKKEEVHSSTVQPPMPVLHAAVRCGVAVQCYGAGAGAVHPHAPILSCFQISTFLNLILLLWIWFLGKLKRMVLWVGFFYGCGIS